MARINIEDKLYTDNRFIKLCVKLGSKRMALGALIEAWTIAQRFVASDNPRAIIPKLEWTNQDLANELIECGLAIFEGEGTYMRGAETQFSWLLQRIEAGRKGGQALAVAKRSLAVAKPPNSFSSSNLNNSSVLTKSRARPERVKTAPTAWPTGSLEKVFNGKRPIEALKEQLSKQENRK